MPDIKLRDGSGVEQTYTGIDTITVPLADGSGTWTYGLTDEELTFSNQNYLLTRATTPLFKKYLKRFKFAPKTGNWTYYDLTNFAFEVDTAIDLRDIIVDANDVSVIYINNFSQNSEISSFPTIINANNLCIGNGPILYGTNESITETEILKFLNYFTYQTNRIDGGSSPSNQSCSFCSSGGYYYNMLNPSDCLKKWHEIINNEQSYSNYTSEPRYDLSGFRYIKELKNIPIPYRNTKAITSNIRFFGYSYAFFNTNSITFATNNGEPYKVNWKNQTIDLAKTIGYNNSEYSYSYEIYGQGYWKEKNNIFYNTTDLEQAKLNYNKLKSQDNWFSWSSKSGTYEGKSNVYYSLLFSRYNHDSAVETINSLPDTSEYLTSAGGTNTIKFTGIQGALTDGGAINTLTEQEIAVATEKGWTVSMV